MNIDNAADELNYVGHSEQDLNLNYSGENESLIGRVNNARRYKFSITNAADATKMIALSYSTFSSITDMSAYLGKTIHQLLGGTDITNITTSFDASFPFGFFQRWSQNNPMDLREIQIIGNDKKCWGGCEFELWEVNPCEQPKRLSILPLIDEFDKYQNQDNKIVIDPRKALPGMQFDSTRVLLLSIGGTNVVATDGIQLQITYRFGATYSPGHALANKRKAAEKNASDMVRVKQALKR